MDAVMPTNVLPFAGHASGATERDGDRYEILGELATGGMATVYLGRMRRPMGFSRLVAVKCMHPQYAKDPSFSSMFVDEARLTARLRHPNIVPTLDIVSNAGHLLLVMEYVEGESLSSLVRLVRERGERLPASVACALVHDVLLGLHAAHEACDDDGQPLAIIHRDVSPQNVLVGLDGLARLLDFGVARARSHAHQSNEGEIKGKLPYMPPEQLFGEALDRRVDVYAAGVILWEALTGTRLFEGPSEQILVQQIEDKVVAAPSKHADGIDPALDALVLRALRRDRDGRFPTALAMAEALSAAMPLPPRTEISAWLARFAKTRNVPTAASTRSTATTRTPTRSSGVLADPASQVDGIVRALERNTTVTSATDTVVEVAPRPETKTRSRATMALAIAACALIGVSVGRSMRAEPAFAASPQRESATARVQLVPSGDRADVARRGVATGELAREDVAATTSLTAAAQQPLDVAAERASDRPAKPDALSAAPKRARDARIVARNKADEPQGNVATGSQDSAEPQGRADEPQERAAKTSAACRLPYVVDAEGHRHYKAECL